MTALGQAKRRRIGRRGRGAAAMLGAALALSACAEAQLGVALAKRANDSLGAGAAPGAATPATTGPGAAPARAAQPPAPGAYDDRALADGAPMIRDAALFSAEAETLWDGLPSLGGAWVAHPGAPRNLVVEAVNLDSGRSVRLPALKLNQRPGRPSIQLSAEAALALGMAPGRLTQVRLTGLRPRPAAPKAATVAAVETFDIAAPAAQAPRTAAPAPASAAPPSAAQADAPDAPRVAAPAVRPDLAAKARDASDAAAPAPGAAPAPARRPASADQARAPQPREARASAPLASAAAAPYVQVGAFGEAANASAAAALFRAKGLPVAEFGAGRLTRVLLGPFADLTAARDARDLAAGSGFADAYVTVQ